MSILENTRVLKLNKGYSPIDIVTAKEAFIDVFVGKSEVVSVENSAYISYDFNSWAEISQLKHELEDFGVHDEWIFTSSLVLQIPRVIRSLSYDNMPKYRVKLNRRNIYYRDRNTCQYCGKTLPTNQLNIDHVVPRSKGGANSWSNLVCSCLKCNRKKADLLLKDAGMKLLSTPREPRQSAQLEINIKHPKYMTWKHFISEAYWTVELEE
jgi:5-methylcytosine-specific restriction endonuclease McrA